MEEKKYFRVGTLFSAILLIILGVAVGISSLILVVGFSSLISSGDTASSLAWIFMGGWLFQIFVMLIGVSVMITTIVIGAKEIRMISMKPAEYKNRTGKIIGHLVFDMIMAVLTIFVAVLFIEDSESAWISFLCFAECGSFVLAFVCLLSSKIHFSIKVKNGKISQAELAVVKTSKQQVNFGAVFQPVQTQSSADRLEQDLVKLKELKEKGLLSEEEYEAQRKAVLEKYSK